VSLEQINIQTITPKYDVIEDRVRICFNHKDENTHIDYMMSRNFLLQLLPSYEEYLLKVYYDLMNENVEPIKAKHKGARMVNHENIAPYQKNAELIISVQFSFVEKTAITIVKFQCQSTEAIVRLDYEGLTNMFSLIKATTPFYDWGISPHI
jgi:hypothetical protein